MLVAGEAGKVLRVHAGIDLSTAEEITLTIQHPRTLETISRRKSAGEISVVGSDYDASIERRDGAVIEKTLAAGAHFEYLTRAGDFPDPGLYRLALEAVLPGSRTYRSRTVTQPVYD